MDYNNKNSVEKNVGVMKSEAYARSGQLYQDIKKNSEQSSVVPFNPLQLYLFEIKQYSLLTREEEKEVAIQLREKNDEEAAFILITSNLRLVVKIALDFHRNWAKNLFDLIQEGNLGLIQAVKKFDPHKGTKFSYYASFWIKAYMLKFIMDNWKLVKIGTTQAQRKLFFNLSKEREKLLAKGFDPHPKLLAERLSVKEEEVVEMSQRLGSWEVSINAPINEESDEPHGALLPDPMDGIDEIFSKKEEHKLLTFKIKEFRDSLCGREADIFDNRIMSEKPETLQQLGSKHNISRERVRQIQNNIVDNIEIWLTKNIPNFHEEYSNYLN